MRRVLAVALPIAIALGAGTAVRAGDGAACNGSIEDSRKAVAEAHARGWLGIELGQGAVVGGLVVRKVVAGSPAATAGFREGDVLVAVNGVPVTGSVDATAAPTWRAVSPGDRMTYLVRRGGKEIKLKATLARIPEAVFSTWLDHQMTVEHGVLIARD